MPRLLPPAKSVFVTSNIHPGKPASSSLPLTGSCRSQSSIGGFLSEISGSQTYNNFEFTPDATLQRFVQFGGSSTRRKEFPMTVSALYMRSLWQFAVCISLTTLNIAALMFLIDCVLDHELSPFVLVSLVPMAWTLTNIWHHASRDLVLLGEAVTMLELEYEAGQRAQRV
jgi:hypothetical protein